MLSRFGSLAAIILSFGEPCLAESYSAKLLTSHEVAHIWKSHQSGSGLADIVLSQDGTKLSLHLAVTGVKIAELSAAGKNGVLGPVHIHDMPQGGPNFFVLQLPGVYAATEDGFTLTLDNWTIEPPKGGAKVDAAFVVAEIRAGKAYIGLHTQDMLCQDAKGKTIACAAPATALSGAIVKSN
ncbi:MAG: CHRD domain-containing protein [Pseudomonadota bacterium]